MNQQQQRQGGWGGNNNKAPADVWQEGSGLFDLSNLKAGDKSRLEFNNNPSNNNGGNNLLSAGDDLDKLWAQSNGNNNSQQQFGFGQQQLQRAPNKSGFIPITGLSGFNQPSNFGGAPFGGMPQQQQPFPQHGQPSANNNLGTFGGPMGQQFGQPGQQQMPGNNPFSGLNMGGTSNANNAFNFMK